MFHMEKIIKKFSSHAEAEKEDISYYSEMNYEKKIELMLNIIYGGDATNEVIERSVRIYPLTKQK